MKSGREKTVKKMVAVFVMVLAVLVFFHSAHAQKPGKVYRIGYLSPRSPENDKRNYTAFIDGMRKLGYAEGKNLVIERRYARTVRKRLPGLAKELIHAKVEVIVTVGGKAARAAQRASKTVPVVMAEATSPVARGLIKSLARPGRNTTGMSAKAPEMFGKYMELLKDTVPGLTRVAVLWVPKRSLSRLAWKSVQLPARKLGLKLHSMEVNSDKELDKAFEDAVRAGAGAIAVMPSAQFSSNTKRLPDLAAKHRLPATYTADRMVLRGGGLMYYGGNFPGMFRRAAYFVDKILKGTNPADLPVEYPREFDLIVNLKAAKRIGLTIPPEVLMRATKVIK